MSGEDVYDVARQWCWVCEKPHAPCEEQDLRSSCIYCLSLIEEGEEHYEKDDDTEAAPYHKQCLRSVLRRRNMGTSSTYPKAPKNRKRNF